jgi:hypothetical protein
MPLASDRLLRHRPPKKIAPDHASARPLWHIGNICLSTLASPKEPAPDLAARRSRGSIAISQDFEILTSSPDESSGRGFDVRHLPR